MLLTDINFKWKFDYEISPEEQTWHEQYVDDFKFKLERLLQNYGINSNFKITFEFNYYPNIRKFYIIEISRQEDIILSALKTNRKFYAEYIIDSIS